MLPTGMRDSVFDPTTPEFLRDPYPSYQRLRAAGQIVRDGPAQWIAARHSAVAALLRDDRLSSEWPDPFQRMRVGEGPAKDFLLRSVLHRQGPDHAVLRRLLLRALHATPAERVEQIVTGVVDGAIQRGLERDGQLDLVADIALPVPVAVACEQLGIPADDRDRIQGWGFQIIKAFTVMLADEDRPGVHRAVEGMRAYLESALATDSGPSRLLATVSDPRADGDIDDVELVDNLMFLLVSGFTTTVHALGAALATLLRHPDAIDALRSRPELLPTAVEELIRFDSPIQHVSRNVVEAFEFEGQKLRAGRVVHLLIGSANRDERCFADPDRLDITRRPNPHVGFGAGLHACVGATTGRLEIASAVRRLLDRSSRIELAGEPIARPLQVFRSYQRIPVRLTG
ncbi:MAG TPA: cytochrome P450 [Jatrophihabitans sp.]|nr:cytochrome P450 [Jatrophihabitans sp.]